VDPRLGRFWPAFAAVAICTVPVARAQEGQDNAAPVVVAPPVEAPQNATPLTIIAPAPEAPQASRVPRPTPPPLVPAGPLPPVRSPTAVLRVLDKVTAETLRFEAPVGRRVRYKTLVFTVKACETRGLKDPQPRPSAYVVVDFEPPAPPGRPAPDAREIYRGWMFALGPGLHPFEHAVYDAWLESCTSDTPRS